MSIYQPGDLVAGRYRIMAPLSQGGMGAVFVAEQISLGREVALKVILARHQGSEALLQRFDAEARAVCLLRHPNIITYHDYGTDDAGRPFLVMEYLPGYPGTELVYGSRIPSLVESVHVVGQLCSALQEAHDRGIIHRDLKWSNAMIVPQSHDPLFTKLIDFGILKVAPDGSTGDQRQQLTASGVLLGTPQYMSPEAICGRPIDGRADQYSLAVMTYELLTGRRPFAHQERVELLRQHVQEPPPPMADIGPAGVPALESAVLRGLAKQPANRFGSVTEFHAALASAVGSPAPARSSLAPGIPRRRRAASQATPLAIPRRPAARTPVAGQTDLEGFAAPPTRVVPSEAAPRQNTAAAVPMHTNKPGASKEAGASALRRWPRRLFIGVATPVLALAVSLAFISALSDKPTPPRSSVTILTLEEGKAPKLVIPEVELGDGLDSTSSAPAAADQPDAQVREDVAGEVADDTAEATAEAPEDAAPVTAALQEDAAIVEDGPAGPTATTASAPARRPRAKRSTARARSGSGTLTVVATPYAQVRIDGRGAGNTPIRAHPVRAGKVLVTLSHPTYGTKTRSVTVKPDEAASLTVDMRR